MKNFLSIIRILDRDGVISLTNIIVYIAIIFSITGQVTFGFMVVAISLYGFGRWINYKRGQVISQAMHTLLKNQQVMQEQLNEHKTKLSALSTKAGLYPVSSSQNELRRF